MFRAVFSCSSQILLQADFSNPPIPSDSKVSGVGIKLCFPAGIITENDESDGKKG
jgi:hypothetical protein